MSSTWWGLLVLLSLLSPQTRAQSPAYFVSRSKSVKDNDINCNKLNSQGKPATYCYECGGIAAVAAKCSSMPRCKGFDMENYDCGYLKAQAGPGVEQDQPGFAQFCKGGLGMGCTGDYAVYVGYDAPSDTDYKCNYKEEGIVQPFCKRDGEVIALMDECDRNAGGRCDGFVVSLESNGKYGWLKKAPAAQNMRARQGYMYYRKTSSNPKGHRRSLQQLGTAPDAN